MQCVIHQCSLGVMNSFQDLLHRSIAGSSNGFELRYNLCNLIYQLGFVPQIPATRGVAGNRYCGDDTLQNYGLGGAWAIEIASFFMV